MISTDDIKVAVVKALVCDRYRVFDERVGEGDFEEGAVVAVSVIPAASRFLGGGRMEERSVVVECAWVDSVCPDKAALYAAMDDIAGRIGGSVTVGERVLKIGGVQYDTSDNVGRVIFDISFCDDARTADEGAEEPAVMEALEISARY